MDKLTNSRINLIAADIIGLLLSFVFSFYTASFISEVIFDKIYFVGIEDVTSRLYSFIGTFAILFLIFLNRGHYTKRMTWWQQVEEILFVCFLGLLIDTMFNFSAKTLISRLWVFNSWIIFFMLTLLFRQSIKIILSNFKLWNKNICIIGNAEEVMDATFAVLSDNYIGYKINKIIITDTALDKNDKQALLDNIKDCELFFTSTENLKLDNKNELFILAFKENPPKILIEKLNKSNAEHMIAPSLGIALYDSQSQHYFGYDLMLLKPYCNLNLLSARIIKRFIDTFLTLIALIILSPIFLIVGFLVKLDGGNVFYRHTRIGKNGKEFGCLKIRSMKINSKELLGKLLKEDKEAKKEWETSFKLKNDPRITFIGKIIRKTSIDELPQLFNVLKGEMSLVGPRPIIQEELKYYGENKTYYTSVRPGITGVWQVSGRSNTTYKQRVKFDVWYANNWSLWNDIVILFKTVGIVLAGKGAC